MMRRPPKSPLFPSPTVFRSEMAADRIGEGMHRRDRRIGEGLAGEHRAEEHRTARLPVGAVMHCPPNIAPEEPQGLAGKRLRNRDRKSTRLNSSHANISYAVF